MTMCVITSFTRNSTLVPPFHCFPLRQTEGFLGSLLGLMNSDLPCPDHTTLSRRNRTVDVQRNNARLPDGPACFIADSTGLKICGQGEWHSQKYGEKRHKGWRKLHIVGYPVTRDRPF